MFWPLESCSEFSGVPKDSQVPFSGVWMATSQLPQSGVATQWCRSLCRFAGHRNQKFEVENSWWNMLHLHIIAKFGLVEAYIVITLVVLNVMFHMKMMMWRKLSIQEVVKSLMFKSIHPNIAYVVNTVATFSQNPKQIHCTTMKRIFKYLKVTTIYSLCYS